MSAPCFLTISNGEMTLPSDLLILKPFPSKTKPAETNSLYGLFSKVATLQIIDELNQPRYWSEPSK